MKKTYNVLFSADNDFQVLQIIIDTNENAWDIANKMFEDGTFKNNNIEHYDICEFQLLSDLNDWIFEQVGISRM